VILTLLVSVFGMDINIGFDGAIEY